MNTQRTQKKEGWIYLDFMQITKWNAFFQNTQFAYVVYDNKSPIRT